MDKIRCPACRGAKKVPKLGGIIGDCNTCKGDGEINECDKPKPYVPSVVVAVDSVIEAVANSVPASAIAQPPALMDKPEMLIKVNVKNAKYRKKVGE